MMLIKRRVSVRILFVVYDNFADTMVSHLKLLKQCYECMDTFVIDTKNEMIALDRQRSGILGKNSHSSGGGHMHGGGGRHHSSGGGSHTGGSHGGGGHRF